MRKIAKKPLVIALAILGILAAVELATTRYGHRYLLNLSNSEPIGLYRLKPFTGSLVRGELVVMNVPEQIKGYVYGRGWLPEPWPLLKTAGALPGDRYCISARELAINGVAIGPVFTDDADGLPLPRHRGCWQVQKGHFLPVATHRANSFDGRYFRTVSTAEIRALAEPLLTFKE